ncbi:MAG: arylsulfotransferase family protein [Candidatus Omnitrophica bacterium]|nr:arylsulfotransferase family protein [Candidatus Omnitrophota bacterium]
MIKLIITLCLGLTCIFLFPLAGYLMGFITDSRFIAAYFIIVSITFMGFFLERIIHLISNVQPKSLPKQYKYKHKHEDKTNQKQTHKYKQVKKSIFSAFVLIVCFNACIFNHYWLSKVFYPFSLITDMIMLYFLILLVGQINLITKKHLFITLFIFFYILTLISQIIASGQIKPLSINDVASLPYIQWTGEKIDDKKSGVTVYNPKLSFPGINFFVAMESKDKATTYLIDMQGNILHQWKPNPAQISGGGMAIIPDDGSILCCSFPDPGIFKLNYNSKLLWSKKILAHHDIRIAANQDIYTLTKRVVTVFLYGIPVPVINDYITILSPSGEIKKEIDLFPLFKNQILFKNRLEIFRVYSMLAKLSNAWEIILNNKIKDSVLKLDHDLFHTNSIQIIDQDFPGLCKKGDILISCHNLNFIAILDEKTNKIVWSWGQNVLDQAHHPTLLENGNILIFDNGPHRKFSRVIELNPLTRKIVWQYPEHPSKDFFSEIQGACQRLANGNTLITESLKSHVLEVTKKGEIVWEFYSPLKNPEGQRPTIFRMLRIPAKEKYLNPKN